MLECSARRSTVVEHNSWHLQGLASREQARRVTDGRREERQEMVDLQDPSATGDGGQAAVSLTPEVDGPGSGSLLEPDASIFESSPLESSHVAGRPYDLHPAAPLIFPPQHTNMTPITADQVYPFMNFMKLDSHVGS